MTNWVRVIVLSGAALAASFTAQAQDALPQPSMVEKALAAKASHVTEVTLGKSMLAFASKFMNGKGGKDADISQLIQGLEGIYVRVYEFDRAGEYSALDVEALRQHFETAEWVPMVRDQDKKTGEVTEVMTKMVNGQSGGLFVLETEPKELTIVLILGHVNLDDLGKLKGIGGLNSLGDVKKKLHQDGDKKGGR